MGLRLRIILNPSSGRELARNNIEDVLAWLSSRGKLERADIMYTSGKGDAARYAMETDISRYDFIVAAGGDGTVNEVITGVKNASLDIPVAIYTSGTVNDFATINKLPADPSDFAKMLVDPVIQKVDCGKAGDQYFLNVLAAGIFTDIAYTVPSELKTAIGPAAYWLSAMKDFGEIMDTMPLIIRNGKETIETDAVMFFVSNTKSVGGVRNLMTRADVTDGLLDVMIIKKVDVPEIMPLLGKLVIGDHINSDKVIYFQTSEFSVESPESKKPVVLDLDGEEGPSLPATIKCVHEAINLVIPKEE